jgi:site-specific DNA-cytosine methylase
MFDERDRKYFYDEFKNNGYEVGSYDDFKNDLNNQEDRDWYYNEAKNMGYDVGTQSDFDKMVMEPAASASSDSKQVAASATPQSAGQGASAEGKQQVAKPVAKPAAEKPKEDNRSWLTKWMTGTLPEEEEQETADKEPGLIAKALNMFPTGVQTSNGTYQPAPAIPQPTVKGEEMPVEVEAAPSSVNVASPESKEEVPASAAVVNNKGLMDAKLANYIENWKQRPDEEGDYFENMVADLLADGTANSNEEAVGMVKSALGRYANRSAMDVTNQVVSSLPDDTVQDAEKSIEAQWYSHGVQDKLKQEADNMGISYDDYVGLFLKPAMVQSLVNKYGPNYRDIAEGIATRLYSHDEHVQDRLMNQDINDAFSSVINKYVNPSVVDEYNKAQEAGSKAFTEGMEGSQFIPANLRLGTALGAQYEANEAKDPAKVLSGLQKKFGKLYRNPEFLNDMSNAAYKVMQRYGLNGTLGSDPKQFKPMINSVLKNELDQLEIKGMMPKGSAEYIMKTGLGNTIVGKITRKAVQTDYQNWLEDMANQQYQPGFWENVASGALTFAGDAWSYWLPGAAGGKLTKSMIAKAEGRLAGDLMAKGMERRVAERAAKVLIGKSKTEALKSGAVHGAVTFGGQSAISKPIDEVYRTGQFDENGKVYNPSVGKIIADTLGEVTKQSAVGAIMQGGTIANMIGKGRGLATNILADIGGKVADSGIMTGHQMLERMAQDPNFKPTGKDAAESFLESMANLTAIGLPGMMGKYARFKDAREFNKKYDFTDQDIAELKRFGYEDLRDAFEKVGIGEYAVEGENAQRLDGQLTQKYMNLMNDKSVPEVLKAKMMAVVEGKRPSSFSPVVDSIIVQPMDHDGKVYLETLNKDGGIIDRKEFSSLAEAQKADKKLEYEKTLGLASVLEGEFHNEFTQEHLDGLYNKAAQKYNMGEKLTDEDKAAVYLHQNAGAIKDIMDKQQKGIVLTEEEQKQVNAYRHYYDSALENSSVMREFVNTFEDSHGVARGTLRKALESKDKKYAPLVESYLMELYNSIELKREMKQTMDDLYNTAHGNEQKRIEQSGIEGEKPAAPVEGAASVEGAAPVEGTSSVEGAAGGQEPPVSEGPAPYQDRTKTVPTPSDANSAANVANSAVEVANSDAFVMGQEAYKNGDSGALQAIDYNSDLATGRLKRAFKDSDNMFDLVTKVYNEGRDMEQFLAQRASLLTSAQKEAISKYVEAMDAKKGAIDALQHADDGYGETLKQQLWQYQTEDGNIVPATLTSGRQVFLKKANEYGGGFVVVPDEQGQPTIKQVSDAEIKEVGTPVPLDEYIESSLAQQKEARAKQFISQFDGSGLKPNDRVTVAMEEGDENIDMTFAGYSEDGKIVLTDGKDNIALTREEFDTWRTNALNNTINENLDREDGERELAEIKRAEAEKQERYKKGIFGYAAGQPDYSDAQTAPKVAAEYLQETAGDDRKALFANIVAEKQALQKRINQLREHISSNEEWLSINADLDPKNAETRTLANKQMEGQIADLQARFDNWNKIRSAVMTPEEAQAIKADRTQKIADAGVNEGDVAPIEGREVAVLSDEELKKQYPTMDEASNFIVSERKRIYRIQSDEVQREIDGVDEVLGRYVNGEIDLEPEQIKELNTTKAQLQARQANLTESAKELKAQADKLKTLYRKENMEARAKVVENLTPAEQRAIKVENAIKNGNMSQLNAIYDEVRGAISFNDTEPNTLEEYVANSIGRFALNYEGKEKGGAFSNGIQQETGLGRKDFDKLQILAKEGDGKTVPEFVHGLYDDMPENLKQMGYTDQDIRSAFLDLIGSAQSYSDIKNYTLNNKVANVEQQMREVERQEEEMMQDGAHSEAFDKIVELAKEQKEYWDLMEQGEVDPDDVAEVDVAHDMDELLKTLSDEEFKEVSDVLENLDEEFEYWTANEYERREGVGERKEKAENANTYDESIKEALKPVTPVAIALKSAVESGDKKAIKQAQKDLTDALIASDLGLDYLSGQLAQAKLVKKKDELYKVKRATIKPLTDAIHAIESAKNIEDAPFADRLKHAIAETETEPTEAQKKAGNYKKGHLTFGGYDFTVETPKGVTRSGKDEQGKPWSVTMHDTYGYILGKIGVDGDHIDMFINDAADLDTFDGNVYVVDQVNPETGEFDEHKVMYGYPDEAAATKAYLSNYSKGWKGLGKVTSVPKVTFDKWLESSDRKTKPFREYAMIQHEEAKKAKQANEALPFDAPMSMDDLPFHRDVKEVKPENLTEAQKVAYDAVSTMLKKAGIPVKVVSNEDMEKVAEAQDNLNLAMLLNQPEMRFKIKTPEEKKAAENAYNFAKELRPDKWKQYAVVDMSNPTKMPEYFEKQELARKERSYYNKLMWGNYKVFNLDKSFEDNVAGLTGSFPSEFDPYKIDEQTRKKNELKKQIKETEDAYNSTGQERNNYQIQLMKEYMDEHGLDSENDIPDDVWNDCRNKSFEKYQDKLDSLFAKYKDLDRQLKAIAEPGVRFLRTYHGSQASFDKFDHSFMGSGEGAQAYGWGTYVSEVEGIAKAYAKQNAKKNAPSNLMYQGKPMTYKTPSIIYQVAFNMDKFNISAKEAISKMIDAVEKKLASVSDTPFAKMKAKQDKDELKVLKGLNPSDFKINDDYDTVAQNLTDTKSGLDLLEDELKDAKSYVDLYQSRLDEAKEELSKAKESGTGLGVDMYESDVMYYSEQVEKYKQNVKTKESDIKDVKTKIDALQKKLDSMEKPRNLYSVDIPDDTGDNYIGWDDPLNAKQIGMWKKALLSVVPESDRAYYEEWADGMLENRKKENNPLTGKDAYYAIDSKYASKKTSMALSKAGFVGVKVIAQRNAGGNKDGKMNYVIFDENNAQIVDHTKFAQGKGVVYGYTDGKEIVLNQEHLNPNTPIHEYQHLWRTAAKNMNPELIAHGDKLIMQTQLFADLKQDPNYNHLTDEQICDEAFARLTGEDGAAILEQMAKDAIKENPLDTAKELSVINKLKEWLKKFWYWTLDTFTKWKPEDIKKMTLEDIRNLVLRDLANGVDPRTVMNEKKEGAKLSNKEKDDATERIDKRIAELNRQEKEQSLKSNNGNLAESHDNGYLPSKDNLDGVQSVAPSSAKIDKKFPTKTFYLGNLANFITSMGKNADITAGNFTKKLFEGMGMTPHGKDTQVSEYFKYQTDDGGKTTVRLSDHSGNALSIIKKGGRADKGYSIVVRVDSSPKTKFKANKYSNVAEYVYENPNADGLKDIARSVFNLIDTGEYLDLAGANEVHVSPRNNDADKTLAGVHNITEEKLRKALKLGGLANPSLAVIDTSKSAHDNFGEISFIAPSALVDKRTGKTGGTWITDAYTQRYPSVEREMSEKGRQKFNDWVDSLEYSATDKAEIKRQAEDALSNNNAPAWELMYLKEKGIDIKAYDSNVDYRWKEIIRDHPTAEDILNSMQTDPELNEKVTSLAKHAIIHPTWEKVSLEVRRKMYKETGVKASPINPQVRKQTKEIFERDYKPTLLDKDGNPKAEDVKKVVEDIVKEHNDTKKYDFYLSKVRASNYVHKNGLYDDFIKWQENKLDEFGTKNRIFRGYKNDGTRKYVPETLENVSKAMREDANGQTNGSEYTSFGSFIAKLASRVDSTDEMRANKDKLSSNEDKEKFYEKWESVYYDLAKSLYNDVFYGEQRLHDIVSQADPKKYAKKEYGITLSSSFMKKLDSLKNAVQNDLKSAYFETKFNRPVHLNEFVAAVVPNNLGEDVRKGLEESGLSLYDYDPEKGGDRRRAFGEAVNNEKNVRFMFAGEKGAAEADKAEEKTYRMDNLKVAEKMERGKKDAKAIKLATGWERGADGRWRYEMPDFKADKPITVDVDIDISHVGPYSPYKEPLCKLSDLIDDKNLFAAYPSLKDIDILLVGNTAFEGMYDKLHNNIALRTNAVSIDSKYSQPSNAKEIKAALEKFNNFWDSLTGEDKELADDAIDAYGGYTEEELNEDSYFRELEKGNPKVAELVRLGNSIPSKKDVLFEGTQVALNHEGKLTLAHEIQHAIQDIEGFAEGGNPEQFQDPSELESQYATFDELVKDKFGNNDAGTVIGIINGSTPEYQQFRSEFGKSWDEYFKNLKGMLGMMNGDEKLFKENYDYYVNEGRKKSAFEQYQSLAGEVEARNVMKRMWMTPEERRNSLAEETEDVNRDEQIVMNGNYASYSIVKDPETVKKLDKEDTVKVYRAMQVGEDGKLYPPMAAKVKGKFVEPIELGKWEQADERPELADDKGMFTLNKGNGKSLKAAYNPYLHTSRTPLNDQFSEAQNRPNIVTVEVEVPKSELTSGYKADKAKDAVGEVEWKAGIIQGQLTGKRKVVLSRWDKPVRIVPDSEVADVIVNDMFKGKNITMPSNVVTPSLRKELEKRGVPFVETDNRGRIVGGENDGVHYSKVYGKNAQSPILKQKLKKHPDSLMKAGTYFSGGGLVEEGLKGIIDPVVAVEYDRKISGVYRNNFGQHIVTADVRNVDPKELVKQIDGEVEYFHASPVCKNYSQANSNGGEVELDKETAKSTADFIDAVKPRVVTIENVKGYKDSEAMKIITQALDKNGYTWDADVYNAADFGGYTNRERLIVRAVKDGELPEKPKKQPRKSGWLEAVEDILPTLKVKESGVAPWMDARLKADGIDWQNVEKPLYVMGSAYADGKIPHAYGDEILPTLRTKSGDVIIMPGGKVLRADGRVLARITGLGDDYLLPKTESLAHTIIGNGIPVQLTQGVIAPLLNKDDLSGRNVLARLGKSIFKNDWDADKQKKVSDQVVNTANKLGGAEATVYTSVDEVPDAYLSDVMNGATGWYDPTTHTVHVYLPNCADANEAERTVLHEKIGHEGMEVLLGGEDDVRKFANFVYNSVAASTRGKILEIANEYDPDWKKHDRMNVGTQEYIARLAEEGPKTAEDFSLWIKIKHYLIKVLKKLGIRVPGLLNDKDLRYYLMKAGKALHVWDDMPEAQQEAMMKQASNAEIKDSLGEGAGKGKPRQKKGESMIQYMKRVQEWRKWKDAREDENDPEPPMFYDIDKDEAGKKEWEQLNKEWRDRHHLAGEEPTGMPIRMKGETDDAYMTRIHDYEKWKDAMKDEEDPIPDMFDFEKSKQEEVKRKYEDWLARHELLEQQQADLDLYEGKIYPAETNPKADDLEQKVMQDLAEVTSTDVSKEGAAKTVKHAVIHRRKNMEEASADDAIYINDVKNRIEKMAGSGVFDKLLSDYKGKANRAEKLAEAIPYIIEAPRRLRDMAHDLNATGAFDKGHIHIQPEDVEAIQPYVADLIAETAKQHSELKDDKEVVVYDDPLAVGEVASKMAQAINNNHQGEEGFVPIDGSDIMSEHVLPLVMQQIVPDGIDYKNLSPEMKAALDSIRDWYNYTYDWLKDNRTLKEDTGYNADYVNHIWDKEKSDKRSYAMYVENRQRTKSPNEKPRTISTLMEGISVGLVPKTTDITKMMAYYSRSNIEAWVNKTMLQELSGLNVIERNEDGEVVSTDPLLSSTPPFNLEQYKYFEIPGLGPVWVYKGNAKDYTIPNIITGKKILLYRQKSAAKRFGVVFEQYESSPFWETVDTLASSAKKLELGFSGFHAGALTEVYMVQNMVEFGPKMAMANFMKYIFVDTMKNHELPCFANPQDFQEAASHLVKFGATNDYAAADVQNMFDNLRDAMMKVQEKLKDGNGISGTVAVATMPLKVVTQLLSLVNKGMDRALWDFLHDGLKLATYRMRADKTKERAKKKGWTEEELSRALDEDGQFVNDMFGGQHWDVLGASHRTLRYAGRVLLSPDWNASTTRHFLALTGYGSIWNEATFENFKQYYQRLWNKELTPEDEGRRGRQISALLCYGIGFMVFYEAFANGVNAAFRAMDESQERKKAEEMRKTNPDYKSMYELAYGDEGMKWYDYLMRGNSLGQQSKIFLGRYADGTEMYIRHGKQFREVPEYLFNHKGELEFPGPMVQRMIGKANPMVRMTLDDINYLSDFQASHADQEIQRKYGKSIGLLYKDALYWAPFLIPSQENKEFKAVDFFFPSSKGFSPWKAQSYFKDFILSGDMEGVVMTYQSCKRNGIDAEAQIKAAIGSVKALESAEMKDGVTSLQVACQRFDAAKSITEKKKMRQKMKKFLSMSDYKAFTQKEALDMVQGYLNGEEDLKEMEKADSKYLMAAKAEDVTEDWRIQNAWNGTMEAYEEYQRLKDIDKAKANAFKNSKTNKRLFSARKAISAAKRKMNKAKKQMDGTNGAAKMVEIRKTRKELLEKLNGME